MNNKFGRKIKKLTHCQYKDEHRSKSLDGMADKILKKAGFTDTLRWKQR